MRTGLTSIRTSQIGYNDTIGNGPRKGTFLNYLVPFLALTSIRPMLTNSFMVKLPKKLDYWSTRKLSLAGRTVVCNQVLLSTLWFFYHSLGWIK